MGVLPYDILEKSQKSALDITPWIKWFLECLKRAIEASDGTLESVLLKARFWEKHIHQSFNERQRNIINHLLDGSFEGRLTSSKWAKMGKCSGDTALRDINDLLDRGTLIKDGAGGRSTGYLLKPQ